MAKAASGTQKGLTFFKPYLGRTWRFEGSGSMGEYTCERRFERILDGNFVRMDVVWQLAKRRYEELAIYGKEPTTKALFFSSFTNDGKSSRGEQVTPEDLPPGGVVFEAQMPAGLARMMFWPEGKEHLNFAVEARNKAGWKRFLEQRLTPA